MLLSDARAPDALASRWGSEQLGHRSVVTPSAAFNGVAFWRSVVVVPLTVSEHQMRIGPSGIAMPARHHGDDLSALHRRAPRVSV